MKMKQVGPTRVAQMSSRESNLAPPDGLEDATHYFGELRDQVGKWSQHNFGDQLPHRPAMGIVEELTELSEALDEKDVTKVLDAVGDIVIYMADYYYRRGWDFSATWVGRLPSDSGSIIHLIGRLCHSHLKGEQNIRGGSEKHDAEVRVTCSYILGHLDTICTFMDRDLVGVVQETWDVVSKRDWKKNPTDAHLVAEGKIGISIAGVTPDVIPVSFNYEVGDEVHE